jgi:hypothetical protein
MAAFPAGSDGLSLASEPSAAFYVNHKNAFQEDGQQFWAISHRSK